MEMEIDKIGSAIFFDRDGVITKPVYSEKFGEYQPPHFPGDVIFYDEAIAVLRDFMALGIPLIVVSNQPDAAKGKVSIKNLYSVQNKIAEVLRDNGITFNDYFYCYHHPDGTVPPYAGACRCRKPKPQFLFDARDEFGLELEASWMIGDQDSDVECGRRAGCRTVAVSNPLSAHRRPGKDVPTFVARDVVEAVDKILASQESGV